MGTTDVLRTSIQQTHDDLQARLAAARAMDAPPDQPRHDRQCIDEFLAGASKHLHAVDAVLAPRARRELPDGSELVHHYLQAVRELEVVLAHVKAHEYGSVYETTFAWPRVWAGVGAALGDEHDRETVLGDRLSDVLDDGELERLTQRLGAAELSAPTRPHPYTPHTGLLGLVARRVMHVVDTFWDTVEGRMVPEPAREPRKRPGLLAQYVLADPRFDEDQP